MRSRHSRFLSLLATVVIAAPSPASGSPSPRQRAEEEPLPARALDASGVPAPWPCRVLVTEELWQFAELAWERSGTFRAQCGKLAAAGAVVVVQAALPDQDERAAASIGVAPEGVRVARIRVRPGGHAVELIAHELEHVLEQIEGVSLLMDTRRGRSVLLRDGAFETRRAIEAGRRVADEVRRTNRAGRQAPKSNVRQGSVRP